MDVDERILRVVLGRDTSGIALPTTTLEAFNPPSLNTSNQATINSLLHFRADRNSDGVVNCADLAIVQADLGKTSGFNPLADVNGDGRVDEEDLTLVSTYLEPGTNCQGTRECTYALSATSEKFGASANRCDVRVITLGGCAWTASSASPWITIGTGANGSGPGSVGFAVAANKGPARTGTLTIAGLTFTVTQAGSGSQGGTQGGQSQQASAAVFRPASGMWYILPNDGIPVTQQWGLQDDIPVPGDYDGDGKIDFAIWRPSTGTWYVIPSTSPGTPITQQWGLPGDVPVTGDFDHDGKSDFAVWRPSNGTWYIILSSSPATPLIQQWGELDDVPVPGDYDGDGEADLAVWRPSNGVWYIIPSSSPGTPIVQQWGLAGDIPLTGDFDGDHKTDFAVWRPSNGVWYVIPSSHPGPR